MVTTGSVIVISDSDSESDASVDVVGISISDSNYFGTNHDYINIEQQSEDLVVHVVSSDEEPLFIPCRPAMQNDGEDLPRIVFESREARRLKYKDRYKHKHKHRRHSTDHRSSSLKEANSETHVPSSTFTQDGPPRIPPLPDLSLFFPDMSNDSNSNSCNARSGTSISCYPSDSNSNPSGNSCDLLDNNSNISSNKPMTSNSNSQSCKDKHQSGYTQHKKKRIKKRQSIDDIKVKEREILGELFAVEKESSDSDCFIVGTANKLGVLTERFRKSGGHTVKSLDSTHKLKLKFSDDQQSVKKSRDDKQGFLGALSRQFSSTSKLTDLNKNTEFKSGHSSSGTLHGVGTLEKSSKQCENQSSKSRQCSSGSLDDESTSRSKSRLSSSGSIEDGCASSSKSRHSSSGSKDDESTSERSRHQTKKSDSKPRHCSKDNECTYERSRHQSEKSGSKSQHCSSYLKDDEHISERSRQHSEKSLSKSGHSSSDSKYDESNSERLRQCSEESGSKSRHCSGGTKDNEGNSERSTQQSEESASKSRHSSHGSLYDMDALAAEHCSQPNKDKTNQFEKHIDIGRSLSMPSFTEKCSLEKDGVKQIEEKNEVNANEIEVPCLHENLGSDKNEAHNESDKNKQETIKRSKSLELSSFTLMAALEKNFRNEIRTLKLSGQSCSDLKTNRIPIINLNCVEKILKRKKRESDYSRESDCDDTDSENDRSNRHFTDIFSDISESDNESKSMEIDIVKGTDVRDGSAHSNSLNETDKTLEYEVNLDKISMWHVGDMYTEKSAHSKSSNGTDKSIEDEVNLHKKETKHDTVTYYDDISEESDEIETKQDTTTYYEDISEASDDDRTLNNEQYDSQILQGPLGGNDYLGNSTLTNDGSTAPVEREAPMPVLVEIEAPMPVLKKVPATTSNYYRSFEMPILEKFSSLFDEFKETVETAEKEPLPDIDEDEAEDCERNVIVGQNASSKALETQNSADITCNQSSTKEDNIFMRFSYFPDNSSNSSIPEPSTSSVSSKPTTELAQEFLGLSGPCGFSTPKISRKRKIVRTSSKPTTSLSCSSSGFRSKSASSHLDYHELPFSQQIDQLGEHLKDFLNLCEHENEKPSLPEYLKNMVYGCEEDGYLNLGHALDFVEKFGVKFSIPAGLCKDVIKSAFHSDCELCHVHWAFRTLSSLNNTQSAKIEVNWDSVEECFKSALNITKDKNYKQVLQASLELQLYTEVLKTDLYTKDLTDSRQIRRSMAYKMFAYDVSTGNRKTLIYFLNQVLHAGQSAIGEENKFKPPDLLPLLQDLFSLCVDVSSSCIDCGSFLAQEMVNTYRFLSSLASKQKLIESVSSPLLQFKLAQLILETQYDDNTMEYGVFPHSLAEIIYSCFKVKPFKNPLTPPPTPTDMDIEDVVPMIFTSEDTEEIVILLYFLVVSYLQASNDQLHVALRLRTQLSDRQKRLRPDDIEELGRLNQHVSELESHLCGMNPDLTPTAEHLLLMMRCLADLFQV